MIDRTAPQSTELNFRQRWASYLTIVVAIFGLLGGFLLKSNIVNATFRFENTQAGISGRYPVEWLLEQGQQDFVVRIQDPSAIPFKTTIQVSLVPIGPDTHSALDVLNPLNITRAASLPTYRTLEIAARPMPNGSTATQMTYAYTATEANPILQTLPVVVRAVDVIVLRTNQAVIITFRADANSFDRHLHYFDAFLRTLVF